MKRVMEWEERFTNHNPDKDLIHRIKNSFNAITPRTHLTEGQRGEHVAQWVRSQLGHSHPILRRLGLSS